MDVLLNINLLTSTADIVAEITHLSKPILAFYKSQNGNNGQGCIQVNILNECWLICKN